MKKIVWLTLIAVGLSAGVAQSRAEVPAVPLDVATVVSGGAWETADAAGTYRVVIVDEGFEHVHSTLWLEWLAPVQDGPPALVARVRVKELSDGFWSLRIDDADRTFKQGRIVLRATHAYSLESRTIQIEAGRPGLYRVP
jgi:hypothetical protein